MVRNPKADKRAMRLAKKVLKKDWDRLQKNGYLLFKLPITKSRQRIKQMIIVKDCSIYGYNRRNRRYHKYCSIIADQENFADLKYSKYDTLVAYYLWLKHFKKNPIDQCEFDGLFNRLAQYDESLKDILAAIDDGF